MKYFKGFLFAIIGLFILVTLVSLLMPSKVMVAKTVMINADQQKVMAAIRDLQNWKYWHPVFKDSSTVVTVSNPSEGKNAFAKWTSTTKENKIIITDVNENEVQLSLQRTGENDISNVFSTHSIKDSSGVQVEWRMMASLKWYPWEKFSGIFFDKMVGPGCELALMNLKEYVEK